MKDFMGKEVHIGDIVVFNEPYYRNLVSGSVLKLTPKGIKVDYKRLIGKAKDTFVAEGQFVIIDKDVIEVKHAHWTGILPSDYSHAEGLPPNATTEQKEACRDYMEHITHCSNCGAGFDDRMVKNWKCCPCCLTMMEVKA